MSLDETAPSFEGAPTLFVSEYGGCGAVGGVIDEGMEKKTVCKSIVPERY